MSSSNAPQDQHVGFTFTWQIHNFSHCVMEMRQSFKSPEFVVGFLNNAKWFLRVYPKGGDSLGLFKCELSGEKIKMDFHFTLSVRKNNGEFKVVQDQNYRKIQSFCDQLSVKEIELSDAYLDNGTLTVQCLIFKIFDTPVIPVTPVKCYATTRILVTKYEEMWTLNSRYSKRDYYYNSINRFNEHKYIPVLISDTVRDLEIYVRRGENLSEDAFNFGIQSLDEQKTLFLICEIHVLGKDKTIVHSVRNSRLFKPSEKTETWEFPLLSKDKFVLNENLYLWGDKLTLRCEFYFSLEGSIVHEVEKYVFGTNDDVQSNDATADRKELWTKAMRDCSTVGKFSDITIRISDRHFPAHRAILCAHSEVFEAMFEHDMKEQNTGFVDVDDLDVDTVAEMLSFLYTGTVDDMDFSSAQKLFYAADKYKVTSLQKNCSDYLIQNINASNVCDILVLADTHDDQDLNSRAREFIVLNSCDIMDSELWKNLMKTHPHVTSEVMHWMISQKFFLKNRN